MKKTSLYILFFTLTLMVFGSIGYASQQKSKNNANNWTNLNATYTYDRTSNVLIKDQEKEYMSAIELEFARIDNERAKHEQERNEKANELLIQNKEAGNKDFILDSYFDSNEEKFISDDQVIKNVAQSFKNQLFDPAMAGQQITNEVFTSTINGEELLFERYTFGGHEYILPKALSGSPTVYSNNIGSTFVFIYNQHLFMFDSSLKPVQLSKDEFNGHPRNEYLNAFGGSLFWAEAPSVSPSGDQVVYYSNRYTVDGKPDLLDALHLYDLKSNEERVLVTNNDLDDGGFVSPYIQWADDQHIVIEVVYPGKHQFVKYALIDGNRDMLLEVPSYIAFENSHIVYRSGEVVNVVDIRDLSSTSFILPEIGYEHMLTVSRGGDVAYPYEDRIVILEKRSGESTVYQLPQSNSIYLLQGFIDDNNLLVFVQKKAEKSSWILSLGGNL